MNRALIPIALLALLAPAALFALGELTPEGGLSPRVRGNHVAAHECRRRPRSIPACAGEPDENSICGQQR